MIEELKQWREALAADTITAEKYDKALKSIDQAIANYTDLDALCQDLQEMTYTQAMRIAELEAKLKEKNSG